MNAVWFLWIERSNPKQRENSSNAKFSLKRRNKFSTWAIFHNFQLHIVLHFFGLSLVKRGTIRTISWNLLQMSATTKCALDSISPHLISYLLFASFSSNEYIRNAALECQYHCWKKISIKPIWILFKEFLLSLCFSVRGEITQTLKIFSCAKFIGRNSIGFLQCFIFSPNFDGHSCRKLETNSETWSVESFAITRKSSRKGKQNNWQNKFQECFNE